MGGLPQAGPLRTRVLGGSLSAHPVFQKDLMEEIVGVHKGVALGR